MMDDLLDEGGAALFDRLQSAEEVDPFCPACGVLLDLHDRASECPDETEARERWGRE
jgi:hypothetical protein